MVTVEPDVTAAAAGTSGGAGAVQPKRGRLLVFGVVAIGFLFTRLTWGGQVVAFIAALCLLGDFQYSDTAGFTLAAAVALWQWRQRSRPAAAAA